MESCPSADRGQRRAALRFKKRKVPPGFPRPGLDCFDGSDVSSTLNPFLGDWLHNLTRSAVRPRG